MLDLWPWMTAGAVLVLLLRLARQVVYSPGDEAKHMLHGGDNYVPPPPPANPPVPPRREVYVLSGSPARMAATPPTPNAPPRPKREPIRVLIAHETCPRCGYKAGGAGGASGVEDDEQTVLDWRGER